jgi:hypothetical protein
VLCVTAPRASCCRRSFIDCDTRTRSRPFGAVVPERSLRVGYHFTRVVATQLACWYFRNAASGPRVSLHSGEANISASILWNQTCWASPTVKLGWMCKSERVRLMVHEHCYAPRWSSKRTAQPMEFDAYSGGERHTGWVEFGRGPLVFYLRWSRRFGGLGTSTSSCSSLSLKKKKS